MNKTFKQFMEQLVVPRGLKKKDPFMTLEKEKQILRDFSNRPSVFNRATTGGRIPGVSEERLVNVRTVGGITRGIDPSTGEIRIIKGRTKKEQEAVKNPPGFEMY